ncbi:DUF3800 domain-containing protein [Catenovulum agarivorans]|uniref:DUF3800 domain-containing protein n=1 Tax=Catenovulum agarivorans TaxID=1172192 RepID=UPI00190F79DC|nr:DUF3800 domain-containing protein [Catenovulum agarivorans]
MLGNNVEQKQGRKNMTSENQPQKFSDFVVYVDGSGDHSLTSINPDYPVFVLAFCIFYKSHSLAKLYRNCSS